MNLDPLVTLLRPRRRVLCVRPKLNPEASSLLVDVIDNWIHALALHCDLEVIEEDFDFKDVCDRLNPHFVIFESVTWCRPDRLTITRANEYPHIPRAFNFNCDPHEPMRPISLQMLREWGVDTLFSYSGMHFKQLHEDEAALFDCFAIPGCINENIYHAYDVEKTTPVCILSAHLYPSFYPWRTKVTEEIQHIFPTYLDLHPGYMKNSGPNPFEVRHEKYASQIARSWFAIADTTRLDYPVGKHLEIPATGTVLIAPDSLVLQEYGLIDLENCILGSGAELYAKMLAVSRNAHAYEAIRRNGYDLVHSRYTRRKWTHIIDWFECRTTRKPGEVTQQVKLFGSFRNVPQDNNPSIDGYVRHDNPMGKALRSARNAILAGERLQQSREELSDVAQWVGHAAEPHFLLGILALLCGDLEQAIILVSRRGNGQGSVEPSRGVLDPCECAWLLLLSVMIGDSDLQRIMLGQAENLPHVNVRRVAWLIEGPLYEDKPVDEKLLNALPGDCISIHWLGQESFPEWLNLISRVLAANGLAEQSASVVIFAEKFLEQTLPDGGALSVLLQDAR